MPRVARRFADDGVYHVLNRGNGRQDVFRKPGDFAAFVELISAAKERYPVKVLAYCLMTRDHQPRDFLCAGIKTVSITGLCLLRPCVKNLPVLKRVRWKPSRPPVSNT